MKNLFLLILVLGFSAVMLGQEKEEVKAVYQFETLTDVPHTAVKSQYKSGTCWSFAGVGFFRSRTIAQNGRKL